MTSKIAPCNKRGAKFFAPVLSSLTLCALLAAVPKADAQTTEAVDSSKPWQGFMNVFALPADGGGYQFGSGWGMADLRAFFTGTNFLTLTPNTNVYNPTDAYWVKPDGSGNKQMDASFYVQDDTLAGQSVTFSGTCLTNSLVSPYTCVAFIKDFAPDYSFNIPVTVAVATGQPFSLNLATTAGHHIQYGFETVGPDAKPSTLASLGQVVMAVNNADPTLSSVPSQALVEGQNASFVVTAKGTSPFTYQWSYVSGGTTNALSNGGRIAGATSSNLTISAVVAADAGAYQVSVANSKGSGLASGTLTVSPLSQVRTNMLLDPGFENTSFALTPDAGWVNFNGARKSSTNDYYYLSATPVVVLDGTNALQTYSAGPGSYNGVYQDRPAVPGQVYTGSAWFLTPSADQISGAGQCWLEVQFQNAGGALLGYYKSAVIDTNTPADTWVLAQPTNHIGTDFVTPLGSSPYMVSPPGTTKVRFQITHHADTGGSVYADVTDLRLREPVTTSVVSSNNVRITFPTLYGPTYQVLYKTNLASGSWQVLSSVVGDGTSKTVSDPIGTTRRFYIVNTQ